RRRIPWRSSLAVPESTTWAWSLSSRKVGDLTGSEHGDTILTNTAMKQLLKQRSGTIAGTTRWTGARRSPRRRTTHAGAVEQRDFERSRHALEIRSINRRLRSVLRTVQTSPGDSGAWLPVILRLQVGRGRSKTGHSRVC